MVTYKGSHGTTKERAKHIRKFGFRIRTDNRHRYGAGVYFWLKSPYYIKLAVGWFKYAKGKDWYRKESNPSCEVIIATLFAEENEVLDLENAVLKDRLAKLAQEKNVKNVKNNWNQISSLVESFVQVMQEEMSIKYKIVLKKAAAPPRECCPEYPYDLLGQPDCCIVKDVTCIRIN